MTADAIITAGGVGSVADLKGKQVAFEEGTTSDILLNYALAANGMSIADIEKVPMPAADAGAALLAERVPVAVTYEPYISLAKAQSDKVTLLYSAGENPGLISDVFIVRDDASTSDLLFQTSDATWQAYNGYGGNSLYVGSVPRSNGNAAKVSYNRPFSTRGGGGGSVAQPPSTTPPATVSWRRILTRCRAESLCMRRRPRSRFPAQGDTPDHVAP